MRLAIFLIVFIASIDLSYAIDKNGKFAIKGVGNTSCGSYRSMIETNDSQKYLFAGWLNGYITAQNQHWPETFDVTSWENIETLSNYVYHYCGENKKLSYFQASTEMLNQLFDSRIKEYLGAAKIDAAGSSSKIYKQVILSIQQKLKKKGFYKGNIDGKYNDTLKESIASFNKDQGINTVFELDQRFLHALLRE